MTVHVPHVPDLLERGESRCEDWEAANVRGERFKCCCGNWCDISKAETLSPDPCAISVCPSCFEKAMDEKFGPTWRDKM